MTYWDLLLNSVNPQLNKKAEQKYDFASKEFITAFTKYAQSIGQKDIISELKQLDATHKSRTDTATDS
jgi:hypothetical protein